MPAATGREIETNSPGYAGSVMFWLWDSIHDEPKEEQDKFIEGVKRDVGRRAEEMIRAKLEKGR